VRGELFPYPHQAIIFLALFVSFLLTAPRIKSACTRLSRSHPVSSLADRTNLALIAIAVAALLLRLISFAIGGTAAAIAAPDSKGYIQLADGLRSGCGFARLIHGACATADIVRTPGYPAFLAMMPSLTFAIVVQAVFAAGVCLLVGLTVKRIWGGGAAMLVSLLICLDVVSIYATSQVMTDGVFQSLLALYLVVVLAGLVANETHRSAAGFAFASGILLAAAFLTRPIGLTLFVVAPLLFALMTTASLRRRIALALLTVAVPASTIVVWTARNYDCCQLASFSAVPAASLYYYRAAGVLSYESGHEVSSEIKQLEQAEGQSLVRVTDGDPDAPSPMTATMARQMTARARAIISQDPVAYIAVTAVRFAYLAFWSVLVPTSAARHSAMKTLLANVLVLAQLLVSAGLWAGVVLAIRDWTRNITRRTSLVLLPLAVALLMLGLAAGPEANARFRVPAVPALAILGAVGWIGRTTETSDSKSALR
jgi:hypothetical protein